jgi:hypothetical protein
VVPIVDVIVVLSAVADVGIRKIGGIFVVVVV